MCHFNINLSCTYNFQSQLEFPTIYIICNLTSRPKAHVCLPEKDPYRTSMTQNQVSGLRRNDRWAWYVVNAGAHEMNGIDHMICFLHATDETLRKQAITRANQQGPR